MGIERISIVTVLFTFAIGTSLNATADGSSDYAVDGDGTYVLTYTGEDESGNPVPKSLLVQPATKTAPSVKSVFRWSPSNLIEYQYNIGNETNAKQPIRVIRINSIITDAKVDDIVGKDIRVHGWSKELSLSSEQRIELISRLEASVHSPKGWKGMASLNYGGIGMQVAWSPDWARGYSGMLPGESKNGFGMNSPDLPGIGKIHFIGDASTPRVPEDADDDLVYILEKLLTPDKNSLSDYAAVPLIPNPSPFDAHTVIQALLGHVRDLTVEGVLTASLGAELAKGLEQAIAESENPAQTRKTISRVRQFLHASQPRLSTTASDKNLPVRVLDFDLRHIEQELQRDNASLRS